MQYAKHPLLYRLEIELDECSALSNEYHHATREPHNAIPIYDQDIYSV